MQVQVKALDSFAHGRLDAHKGGEYPMSKGEADDLRKAGLVEIIGADDSAPKTATDSQGADDLLGDAKSDAAPQNKMAPAPANKKK